ncbi:MAG TPA: ABC transporter permease [Candidatus Hydrogenedentes bacterium]|nr:ABC transporter permease [Candidatus Hydrogenedentota bacterium]
MNDAARETSTLSGSVTREAGTRPGPSTGGFWRVFRRELRRISGSPFFVAFVLILPYPTFLILSLAFLAPIPRDLPVVVCDMDNSTLSREIIRRMDASPAIQCVERVADMSAAAALVREARAHGVLYLPFHFERDTLAGEAPPVTVFLNNQWLLTSGIITRAARDVVVSASEDIDRMLHVAEGNDPPRAVWRAEPIRLDLHPLFNPGMNYRFFLLPALLPVVLQMFIAMTAIRAIGMEFRSRTAAEWLQVAGGSPGWAVLGKLAPYTLYWLAMSWFMWVWLHRWFDVPIRGSRVMLAAGTLLLVLAYQAMALLFIALKGNLRLANSLAGFYCGPAFAFSGVTFPRLGMPLPAWIWGGLLPVTHYLRLVYEQAFMETPLDTSARLLLVLLLFTIVPGWWGYRKLRRLFYEPEKWGQQ